MIHQKISYIICFRDSNEERRNALRFKLAWMWEHFPEIEVIVVEQDSESKLNLKLPPNCKKIFIFNPSLFNRSWAFNVAALKSNKELLVFSDSDIFLKKEDYETCFKTSLEFDMCKPNLAFIYNVKVTSQKQLTFEILNERKLYTLAGGLIFMKKSALISIGGWDERFEGWGGEDAALSKLIVNKLSFKILNLNTFHIDHDRSQAKKDNTFQYNWNLAQEIGTYEGQAINNYVFKLQNTELGNPNKYKNREVSLKPTFVLAITTFNRKKYLLDMLSSFLTTKSSDANWTIIIADDGSNDGTIEFIKNFDFQGTPYYLIENHRFGIHHQVNTILKHLSSIDFDMCFKCDDDLYFKDKGWDHLYWNTSKRTGYQHLIYFDKSWRPSIVRKKPLQSGNLISNCELDNISGALYTITPDIIKKVGYFDVFNFGFRGIGHQDYSMRCCRAGFNVIENPFDITNSNDYIELQNRGDYITSLSDETLNALNPPDIKQFKNSLKKKNRIFIPYNENYSTARDILILKTSEKSSEILPKTNQLRLDTKIKNLSAQIGISDKNKINHSTLTTKDHEKIESNEKLEQTISHPKEDPNKKEKSVINNIEPNISIERIYKKTQQDAIKKPLKNQSMELNHTYIKFDTPAPDPYLEEVLNSWSWKITAPLRWLASFVVRK